MKFFFAWLLVFFLLIAACHNTSPNPANADVPLFQLLSPDKTGIHFINEVEDGDRFNVLTYRNYYNGGGVAIGDINNDSLPDIYFTSNQKKNKLYLNKGNFVFEDITDKAGVGGTMAWSTGVTMADVNNDGLLDIYVCNSGDVEGNNKKNELFINNGNLTFTEKAKQYNLDNDGYSTHAAFFDYDMDGDLDCYILNNSFRSPGRIELYKKMREQPSPGGHRLMRNDGNIFTDVTQQAGIYSSDIAFGLGVAVSDLNGDHLPDIYISNDFWERDYLYINKGNGTFSEESPLRVNYCSTSSMGADIADLNNDGAPEIFTTDMLPEDNYRIKTRMAFDPYHLEDAKYRANYHYQFTQNCLHLNDGSAGFAEIALMSGVAATDWSWGALIFDFENDGKKDIYVSNGILKDITSMDFLEFEANQAIGMRGGQKIDYKNLISHIPTMLLQRYAFSNLGNMAFKNNAALLGLSDKAYSNGAAYADLNNDGAEDLVVNNINSPCFIYRNNADHASGNHFLKVKFKGAEKNLFGIGAEVTVKSGNGFSILQNYNTRGFQSSIEPLLLFGLGKATVIDSLQVSWPDGKVQVLTNIKADQTITLKDSDASVTKQTPATPIHTLFAEVSHNLIDGAAVHHENRYNDFDDEILLVRMLSTEGPRIIQGDINNDKLTDFILLGATGDPDKLFVQKADGKFHFQPTPAFIKDAGFESTCGALFDYDKDGDPDLIIGSGGNQVAMNHLYFTVRLYLNNGNGNFIPAPSAFPPIIGNFSTIAAEDIDHDGDVDIFLGARNVPGNYGLPPHSFLLRNDNGKWTDITPPSLANAGMVTDAAWADIDADGDKDLIVVGDWMAITIFKNENGTLSAPAAVPASSGWWNRIKAADLDGDGDMDFVVGNWGLNTKFKASAERPLTMFVNDFDNNGKSEFIINWYPPLDSIAYPFATKSELTSQLPFLKSQILKYEDYAHKTYESLFSPEIQERSLKYEANFLQTAILWNNGGSFELQPLPFEAQLSPLFGIITDDIDGDGKTDIWLGGNFYALKPQAGRHDASKGVLLKGNGSKSFTPVPPNICGIKVEGEVRDAAMIEVNKSKHLIVGRNNASVLIFERNKK
ncbi:MAG: VCBS repeat-containing protein [Chitinophagaceae bacterium]|nr:VCBS repeat-containing protein [Chitinophagaceae bacterium]